MQSMMRKTTAPLLVLLCTAVFIPYLVAANIRVEPRLEDPLTGVLILIVTNFAWDLFLIAAAVYGALEALGMRLGDIAADSGEFIAAVILAAAGVAVAGGVIDFVFLYERVDDYYTLKELTVLVVLPATGLIFATVTLFVLAFVGARPGPAAVIAAIVAPMSPLAWWASGWSLGVSDICGAIVLAISAFLALGMLVLLRFLHVAKAEDTGEPALKDRRP